MFPEILTVGVAVTLIVTTLDVLHPPPLDPVHVSLVDPVGGVTVIVLVVMPPGFQV